MALLKQASYIRPANCFVHKKNAPVETGADGCKTEPIQLLIS